MAFEAVDTRARTVRSGRQDDAGGILALVLGLDWVLFAAMVALVGYGLWAIEGITRHDAGALASRQAVYAAAGGAAFVVAMLIDPALYRRFSRFIFGTTLGL